MYMDLPVLFLLVSIFVGRAEGSSNNTTKVGYAMFYCTFCILRIILGYARFYFKLYFGCMVSNRTKFHVDWHKLFLLAESILIIFSHGVWGFRFGGLRLYWLVVIVRKQTLSTL